MRYLIKLGKKLWPLNRSLTGQDNRRTLLILKEKIPNLKIKYFRSGSRVFDWVIPDEWNVKDAYIRDKDNKKIVSFKKNNLHLVSYSQKIKTTLNKNQLIKKLFSNKSLSNAIPYVTSYYKKDWGFCITHNQKIKILKRYNKEDKFKVLIDSSFKKKGLMHYGEVYIPGKSKEEILLTTYICHPSMANNELSGPLVTLAITKYFEKKDNLRSIRILFIPETIGSIAYIHKNLKRLKRNVVGGYVVTCIGDDKSFSYLETKYGNTISDQAALQAFKKYKIKFKKYSFLKRGSDERQFNSPHVNLNLASIMRSKYGEYREYHTSLDNFDFVSVKGLEGGFKVLKQSIKYLLKLKFKKNLNIINNKYPMAKQICEPHLSKRNLTYHLSNLSRLKKKYDLKTEILNFLQYADGSNDIKLIAKYTKSNLRRTRSILKLCKKNKLII